MRARPPRRHFLKTLSLAAAAPLVSCGGRERIAVLTFDDAVKSHRTFVAPLLADLGFSATFFVSHRWMPDTENFMSWEEIAEIAQMGFEIGNHSWTHANFAGPDNAARLESELALVENELAKVKVDKPVSFAWCGNGFGPEAYAKLKSLGYRFARRGMQPEIPYGEIRIGPVYDPTQHDPLLIPTTADAYPDWTFEHFQEVLKQGDEGVVVLQFHGVPDVAHPWVHTPPENFRRYMEELRAQGFRTMAMRDLAELAVEPPPDDPTVSVRYPQPKGGEALKQPTERVATRENLDYWLQAMARHGYSAEEAAQVAGLTDEEKRTYEDLSEEPPSSESIEVWPYPGGRHPRIEFLEGAINPLRGTKASIFLPWAPKDYIVLDLPELITSHLGHLFLAHTHVPTIWNDQNVWIENVDWRRGSNGSLELEWPLPNGVVFGAAVRPGKSDVDLELWLRNGLEETLTGLRTQLCIMLKGAPEFNALTRDNKTLEPPVAAVRSASGDRWILTAWERTGRSWGNPRCPCMHADPVFEDCPPGETVRLRGRIWFHEGDSIDDEMEKARRQFTALPQPSDRRG